MKCSMVRLYTDRVVAYTTNRDTHSVRGWNGEDARDQESRAGDFGAGVGFA